MRTVQQQKDIVLAAFIKDDATLDDTLPAFVHVVGADECLRLATMAGQPDIMRTLINAHGANVHQTRKESSDRGHGTINRNLMDDLVDSLLHRTDIDRSETGKKKFYEVADLLAKENVGVNINADPMESPMMGAHLLALPEMAQERDMPHCDLIVGTVLEDKPEANKLIFALFMGRFPDDVKKFMTALEDEKTRLRATFSAARRHEHEEETPEPRSIGQEAGHLAFSATHYRKQ